MRNHGSMEQTVTKYQLELELELELELRSMDADSKISSQ
jgi:hypothetical protein